MALRRGVHESRDTAYYRNVTSVGELERLARRGGGFMMRKKKSLAGERGPINPVRRLLELR